MLLAGLLSAFGIAIFSLSEEEEDKLQEDESTAALTVKRLLEKPDYIRTTIRISKVFLNVALTLCFSYGLLQLLDPSLSGWIRFIIILFSTAILLFVSEELIPRAYIGRKALPFSLKMSSFIYTLEKTLSPITHGLVAASERIYKNITVSKSDFSMDGLGKAFAFSSDKANEDTEMIAEIIKFYGKTANEIMTPRLDMEDIDIKSSFKEVIEFIVKSGYSRIPVYLDTEDNIKGVLYIKDLLPHLGKSDTFRWQSVIRPAYFVPETKKIDDLLEEFRTKKIHMAIVVDEFGGTSGLVTMEDILEEIVGDISDEYDDDEKYYIPLADGSIIFEAKTPLNDFFRIADVQEEEFGKEAEEAETLAGLLLEIKGDMPKRKEIVQYGIYSFQILEADNRRILKVKFSKENTQNPTANL